MVHWCFSFLNFLLKFWNERYLQSHWPLAAKYGTWLANSLQGSDFAYVSYNGRGEGGGGRGIFIHVSPVRRCFSLQYFRDIFSVVKLTYSFWFATGGVSCYIVIPNTFTLVAKYINV